MVEALRRVAGDSVADRVKWPSIQIDDCLDRPPILRAAASHRSTSPTATRGDRPRSTLLDDRAATTRARGSGRRDASDIADDVRDIRRASAAPFGHGLAQAPHR
jgi:hypothetical protein